MTSDGETSGEASGQRTDAERLAIVTEAFEDGNSVSEIAERRGVATASIYLWRRQLRNATTGDARKVSGRMPPPSARPPSHVRLVPVRLALQVPAPAPTRIERLEIAFANGRLLKVCESIDPVRLAAPGRGVGERRAVITVPAGVKINLACGATDMRKASTA